MPSDLACDVMQWAYVEHVSETELEIFCDLDDGSLTNSGGWVEGEDANVGCDKEESCDGTSFALREIGEGEEILCDYDSFVVEDGWEEFGL